MNIGTDFEFIRQWCAFAPALPNNRWWINKLDARFSYATLCSPLLKNSYALLLCYAIICYCTLFLTIISSCRRALIVHSPVIPLLQTRRIIRIVPRYRHSKRNFEYYSQIYHTIPWELMGSTLTLQTVLLVGLH